MNRYLERAKEYTGCDNAEIIYSKENGTRNLVVCAYTDDDGYCHCWLLRVWKNPFGYLDVDVKYENITKMEDADAHMAMLGIAIAKAIA